VTTMRPDINYLTTLSRLKDDNASPGRLTRAVVDARNDGHSWDAIAQALNADSAAVQETFDGAHVLSTAVARVDLVAGDIADIYGWTRASLETIAQLVEAQRLDRQDEAEIGELYAFYAHVMTDPDDVSETEIDVIVTRAISVIARLITLRYEAEDEVEEQS
jgi:hypothetical protein